MRRGSKHENYRDNAQLFPRKYVCFRVNVKHTRRAVQYRERISPAIAFCDGTKKKRKTERRKRKAAEKATREIDARPIKAIKRNACRVGVE